MLIISVFVLAIGLAVGSFLNVVIYRLPKEESLWYPSSHCPKCDVFIKWYDNIPLISFLFLKGKCRNCQSSISWRYPLVEALTGIFLLICFLFYFPIGFSSLLFFLKDILFIFILIPIFFIDLKEEIIPNSLSYSLIICGFILSFAAKNTLSSLIGIGLGAGIFLSIFALSFLWLKQTGMGMGDIKLAAGIGAFLGYKLALLCFSLSVILGGIIATGLLLTHTKGRKDRIPFAPFLVASALISLFWGENLIHLYLNLIW